METIKRLFPAALACLSFFFNISCASVRMGAMISDSLSAGDYARAGKLLDKGPAAYGKGNKLLYLLDKGYVLHAGGDYRGSIAAFEQAKQEYDALYSVSLSKEAATWLVNDYLAPYRGEDFERVLVNIFQAVNYCMLGDFSGALVEARQVDERLRLINSRYNQGEKNVYKEDAFARLLSGLLYETEKNGRGENDAYIAYAKAVQIYEEDYKTHYGLGVPLLLKQNFLAAAQWMGSREAMEAGVKFRGEDFLPLPEKAKKAEVILFNYNGRSPYKKETAVPVPLPDGYVLSLAFPSYERRPNQVKASSLRARSASGQLYAAESEPVEDICAIAEQNLDNRRVRVIAKMLVTAGGKYALEKAAERRIEETRGENTAIGFRILSSLYNIFSNRADLRCWQTLPAEIRAARLLLEPGVYDIFVETSEGGASRLGGIELGRFNLSPGEKKFLVVSTWE
ncbi:MAG: hypothetical protein WC583_02355 [Candidatus Omnitrophota bacterium]|jgi:hypothetical protein|nr:hypothetical protein [Candidatus Omnitrophota bacterium]MDD3983522.1 hypothetical protein [Candidatus Omnitrophota bacterium]MDD5526549.1 hypothetical protein [Candidatus Omnitrophota bacterium]